ncbi:MAG: cytochrome P450, partial [Acidimicrobiaceae bacterium]
EIKALLAELIPRVTSMQLAGEPSLMKTTFVGGLKHLPITYEMV